MDQEPENPDKLEYLQLSYISDNHTQMLKLLHVHVPVSKNFNQSQQNQLHHCVQGQRFSQAWFQIKSNFMLFAYFNYKWEQSMGNQKFWEHASWKA